MKLPTPASSVPRLLAVAILAVSTVHAVPVPDPASGDIFLGIRAAGGEGGNISYLVNLGPDTVFRNAAAGTSFEVTGLGGTGADLAANFGADWHSREDVLWGIFGARNSISPVVYGSKVRASAGVPSTPWPALGDTSRGTVTGAILSVQEEVGGYKNSEATANSPRATVQTNAATASSYAFQVGSAGTSDFGSLSLWSSIEGVSLTGIGTTALDLYRISSTGVTRTGTFTIGSSGALTFTAPAPPAAADSDGDGFTDAQETYAGTNPNDASSFISVTSVTPAPTGIRVQSPAAPNRSYTIQYTPDLLTAWQDIGTHTAGAAATPVDFTDSDPGRLALSKGFYRIRIQ